MFHDLQRCIGDEPRMAIYYFARKAQDMQGLGNRVEEAAATGALAFAYGLHGQFQNACAAAARGVALAGELDHLPTTAASYFYRGVVHGWRGELGGARLSFATALELAGRARDPFCEYVIRGWRGEASLYAGKLASAGEDLRLCLRLGDELGTSFHRGGFQACLARVLLLQGSLGDALALSACAVSHPSGKDYAWGSSIALRVRAEVLLAARSLREAETAARAAIRIQEQHEWHPDHARSLLALAAVLATGGDRSMADAALAEARGLFDAMGMRHKSEVTHGVAARRALA